MAKIRKPWVIREELFPGLSPATVLDFHQIAGLLPGSIPHADASGLLTEDNPNFFWDADEKNLGIGTNIFSADMERGIQIATGEEPTADVADTFAFYSKDFVAGNACPYFRTENGTVIGLNQSLLTTDNVIVAALTVNNTGLHILDTGGDHYLTIKPNENLSANRVLSIVTGDAARTITLSGNPTLADWFDQAVKIASHVQHASITVGNEGLHILDTGGDHDLIIKPGTDLGADRILTITTGDAARTITLSGNPTLDDWFDQSVKRGANPTFGYVTLDDIRSATDANQHIYMDLADEIRIHPGYEDTDNYFILKSTDDTATNPQFYPSADGEGQLGIVTQRWYSLHLLGFAALYSNAELRFYDNGNYVGFKAPALVGNKIWILPAADGNLSDVLVTDGAGNLSWSPAGAGDVTAAAVLADHTLIRGDGGAKGVQDSGINIDDADNITLPDGASINLQEDITFLGATAENQIKFPDDLPDALSFLEGANPYLTFITTDGSEAIHISVNVGIGTATIPHGGVGTALLALEGGDQNMATSPVVQWTTDADNYPLMQIGFWSHDSMWMFWDAYSDAAGTDKSSDAGSNFGLRKTSDAFQIVYDSGIAQGGNVTWNVGFAMDASGDSVFTTSGNFEAKAAATDSRLHITTFATAPGSYSRGIFRTSDSDTLGTLSETQNNDYLGIFEFQGVNSTPGFADGAYILARQHGAAGADFVPSDMFFITYSATGANNNQLVLQYDGRVGVNVLPSYLFHVESSIQDWNAAVVNTDATTPYGLLIRSTNAAAAIPLLGVLSTGGYALYVRGDGVVTAFGCIADGTCEIMKDENAIEVIDYVLKTGTGKKDKYNHERMDMKKIHGKYPFLIQESEEEGKKEYYDKLGAKGDLAYAAILQLEERIKELETQLNN